MRDWGWGRGAHRQYKNVVVKDMHKKIQSHFRRCVKKFVILLAWRDRMVLWSKIGTHCPRSHTKPPTCYSAIVRVLLNNCQIKNAET